MKKFVICIIFCGLALGSFAQGGLFGFGETRDSGLSGSRESNESFINLPSSHGDTSDASAPLGSGSLLLIGLGAAYALKKKSREK